MVGFTREMVELPSEIVGARNGMVEFARETYESTSEVVGSAREIVR